MADNFAPGERVADPKTWQDFKMPPVRCSCCAGIWQLEWTDDETLALCALCRYSAVVCGRCPEHGSRVFFPHLTAAMPPKIPDALREAYEISLQPTYVLPHRTPEDWARLAAIDEDL